MTLSPISIALALAAATAPAIAPAAPLTIKAGESWVFEVDRGEPLRAHRVKSSVKPGANQIKATVISTMGTTMTMSNNSSLSYTFRAELIGAAKSGSAKARTCTLPPGALPVLEYWPVKSAGVRVSAFKATSADGNCP